jgi:hypothetical protein
MPRVTVGTQSAAPIEIHLNTLPEQLDLDDVVLGDFSMAPTRSPAMSAVTAG